MILGWPNGATRRDASLVISSQEEKQTLGTETSQYREEEESIEMPEVAASETGRSPNRAPCGRGVVGPTDGVADASGSPLEQGAREGESPVDDSRAALVEFLSNARPE